MSSSSSNAESFQLSFGGSSEPVVPPVALPPKLDSATQSDEFLWSNTVVGSIKLNAAANETPEPEGEGDRVVKKEEILIPTIAAVLPSFIVDHQTANKRSFVKGRSRRRDIVEPPIVAPEPVKSRWWSKLWLTLIFTLTLVPSPDRLAQMQAGAAVILSDYLPVEPRNEGPITPALPMIETADSAILQTIPLVVDSSIPPLKEFDLSRRIDHQNSSLTRGNGYVPGTFFADQSMVSSGRSLGKVVPLPTLMSSIQTPETLSVTEQLVPSVSLFKPSEMKVLTKDAFETAALRPKTRFTQTLVPEVIWTTALPVETATAQEKAQEQ